MQVIATTEAVHGGFNSQFNAETLRRASLRAYEPPISSEIKKVCAPSLVSLSRDPALDPLARSAHDVVTQASVAALAHVMKLNIHLLTLLDR